MGRAKTLKDLHRCHGCEEGSVVECRKRTRRGANRTKRKRTHERANHHHLSRNEFQRQAEQGGRTVRNSEETKRSLRAANHPFFFDAEALRLSGASRSLHAQGGFCIQKRVAEVGCFAVEFSLFRSSTPHALSLQGKWCAAEVGDEKTARAQSLRKRKGGVVRMEMFVKRCSPLGNRVEPDVGLQGAGHPIAHLSLACQRNPLFRAGEAAVERRLEDEKLRAHGVKQGFFLFRQMNSDEFFVKRDGNRSFLAEFRQGFPLPLTNGLFDAVNPERFKLVQTLQSLRHGEAPVGVQPQFHVRGAEACSQRANE